MAVGVIQMSIDGGTTWEPLNMTRSYTLPTGDGSKSVTVYLKDDSGNQSEAINDSIMLDATPPTGNISNVIATSTTSIAAMVWWQTIGEATFSRVEFGVSSGTLSSVFTENTATTTHVANLTGLMASTTYYFRVKGTDNAGNAISSGTFSFRTPQVGEIWNKASTGSFPARCHFSSLVFDNRMWLVGGEASLSGTKLNDVWRSNDGVNWSVATTTANFSKRYGHNTVVFNNKMFVIGGNDGSFKNDVWSSSDGINWSLATGNAGFTAREDFAAVVFDQKIWVLAGLSGGGFLKDVWNSLDGGTWTLSSFRGALYLPHGRQRPFGPCPRM